MTATNHVVTGALIATAIHNPWVALPVALLSHFVLDALPHFDYLEENQTSLRSLIGLAGDIAVAASILVGLIVLRPLGAPLIVACAVVAASPDLTWLYYLVLKPHDDQSKRPAVVRFHSYVQKITSFRLWPVELAWLMIFGGILASRLK